MATATKRHSSPPAGRAGKHAPYLRLLRSKRAELLSHLWDHRQDVRAERIPEDGVGLASQTLLEDLAVGMIQREQQLLGEVEAALARLQEGLYGVCESCGADIPERRLRALPWTRLCRKCAEPALPALSAVEGSVAEGRRQSHWKN